MTDNKQDRRIYTLSQEKPAKAVVKMGVQPITEFIMMIVSVRLLTGVIGSEK